LQQRGAQFAQLRRLAQHHVHIDRPSLCSGINWSAWAVLLGELGRARRIAQSRAGS